MSADTAAVSLLISYILLLLSVRQGSHTVCTARQQTSVLAAIKKKKKPKVPKDRNRDNVSQLQFLLERILHVMMQKIWSFSKSNFLFLPLSIRIIWGDNACEIPSKQRDIQTSQADTTLFLYRCIFTLQCECPLQLNPVKPAGQGSKVNAWNPAALFLRRGVYCLAFVRKKKKIQQTSTNFH